jgi:RimJ/RimL family protein N-acetyltransferase
MDDLTLLKLEAEVSFTYDANGRMLQTNEPFAPARRPAPRIRLYRTMGGEWFMRFAAAMADEVVGKREDESSGPAYCFPETILAARAIAITQANRDVARETFRWLFDEVDYWQPCFAVLHDGQAVAVCFSSRVGDRACAAGVETLPEFRGRGFASETTAGWALAVRASGRIPLYGTDWQNLASRGVARRLGLRQYGETTAWN